MSPINGSYKLKNKVGLIVVLVLDSCHLYAGESVGKKELRLELESSANIFGFESYNYCFCQWTPMLETSSLILENYPAIHQVNCRGKGCHYFTTPAWNDSPSSDELSKTLEEWGVKQNCPEVLTRKISSLGVIQSCRGDGKTFSLLSFSSKQNETSMLEYTSLAGRVKSLAQQFHCKVEQFIANKGRASQEMLITEREKEIFLWTAEGKTCHEIAIILEISKRTVDFHIANVISKMGVSNKLQACVQLARKGFL